MPIKVGYEWIPLETNQFEQKSNGDIKIKDSFLDSFVDSATSGLQDQIDDLAAAVSALQMGTDTGGGGLPAGTIDCSALNLRLFIRNANGSDGAQVTEVTQAVPHNLYLDLVDSEGTYLGPNIPVAGRLNVTNGMGSEVFDNNDAAPTNKYIYTPPSSGTGNIDFTVGATDATGTLVLCNFSFPINVAFTGVSSAGMTELVIQNNDISEANYSSADFAGMVGPDFIFFEEGSANGITSVGSFHGRRAIRADMRPFPSQASRPSTRLLGGFGLPSLPTVYRVLFDMYIETPFSYGDSQQTAKLGLGMGGHVNASSTPPSGGTPVQNGFTNRIIYRGYNGGNDIELNDYRYSGSTTGFGDDIRSNTAIPENRWCQIAMELHMNSAGGVADGISRTWLDGNLIIENTDVEWFGTGTPQITRITLEAFMGGNTDQWEPQLPNNYVYFSNLFHGAGTF